nr:SDR family NAD(P)-dependent oxidoreductase [candidate division KSB1 bacterium]NIV70715.1 SDR family NAD(P)-dependent oxidoreductase [Phycisphaerae bacterium]NIR72680.1 SDR family NAD(P)-dependent oxidoreductase [candidate division KSB1 bacterium]NIS23702.1 SDR family NAD(P)-dependent oxidoreductase [candidate division KSB1 bacterium]NIT70622.1 SDR family NAD(P)-dependent oxidoreductase [candidate division KSB1 bacterium]
KGGVYLVTGGFGGIGLALSEYLAQTVRAKLILTGRKGLPQRTEWEQWLVEHDETDDTSRKIRKVRELEALGAEVLVAGADVSNLQQMKEVIKRANQRFGRIHGLIHSAGVAGGGMIQLKSLEAAEQVLAPKVKGTQVLELLFKDTELDFMVLCSSLAATIGGIGQIDYCGANAFLDAFALHASRNGRIMVSISWDTWQEVGMAVNTEVPDELKAQRDEALKKGMTTREGMDVFSRILQSSQPHVLVSTSDLRRRIEKQSDQWETPADQEGAEDSATSEPMHARPGLSTEYVAPRSEIEKNVARIWQRLFGIEQIGVHDDFFELGGHSLLATQLLNKLRKSYDQAELSLRNFFENATVAGVTELIQKTETKGGLLQTFLNTHSTKERKNLVENYLKEKVTQNLKMRPDKISVNDSLIDHGLDSITPDLIWELKRDFGLRVYPFEILKNPSIKNLTDFVSTEVDRMDKLQELYATSAPPNFDTGKTTKRRVKRASQKPAEKKNKGIIFLLSAPRSGSTLLRLMLSGHPALFCPPELGLLAFDTVQAWSHNQLATFSKEGAIRNLMVCTGLDYDKCHELLNGASQKQKSIQQVYSLIQDHAGTRILVDKTPGYAMNIDTLERAEALFEKPKYICLIRHPYPVIDSFVRNRFEKLFGEEEVDPFWFAEKVWATCNHNIRDFFERIDAKCCYKVRYETLVSEPEKVMRSVCEFLNLEFEEPVLHPYEQGEMLAGPGDPDILQHDKIDASLGDIWKKIKLPRRLSDFSQRLAAEFGYDLPQEDDALTAESKKVDPSHARKLLENLDGLSDDEVNALLSEMLTSEEKRNV